MGSVVSVTGPEASVGSAAVRAPTRRRLVELCADWLDEIARLPVVKGAIDTAALRAHALEFRDRLENEGREQGFSAADISAATYALAAFTDEMVILNAGAARASWMARPLALELFKTLTAGKEFFDRVDAARRDRTSQVDLLEVYYACIMLGFEGKYRLEGHAGLVALAEELQRDIVAVRGPGAGALSPHAVRRDDPFRKLSESVPSWLSVVVFVGAVALVWIIIKTQAAFAAWSVANALGKAH
jgi:type VI secretion system protein ImpK